MRREIVEAVREAHRNLAGTGESFPIIIGWDGYEALATAVLTAAVEFADYEHLDKRTASGMQVGPVTLLAALTGPASPRPATGSAP